MSRQAQRLVCLAGVSWSFDRASKHLREFCGWTVSDSKIRSVCHDQAGQMIAWQRVDRVACDAFRTAAGDAEFTTDGTMVNTTEGWREIRLGLFSKRPAGEPATPAEWATRTLPEITARVAFAAIEASGKFGSRWHRWAERLGIRDTTKLSIVADGARWIWEESGLHFAGATEVLDVFHALEHVSSTAAKIYGEATDETRVWADTVRNALISKGWEGVQPMLETTRQSLNTRSSHAELSKLEQYLGRQPEHLCYAERLEQGRTIGSGEVEGACRHMIGRRLKNGGRWKVRRANRMAGLCANVYCDLWDAYWKSA